MPADEFTLHLQVAVHHGMLHDFESTTYADIVDDGQVALLMEQSVTVGMFIDIGSPVALRLVPEIGGGTDMEEFPGIATLRESLPDSGQTAIASQVVNSFPFVSHGFWLIDC